MNPNEKVAAMHSSSTETAGKPPAETGNDRLLNKKIALIIWNSEDKKDVQIVQGMITHSQGEWAAENSAKHWRIPLDAKMLQRLRPVTADDGPAFKDADFGLSLNMASLAGNNISGYEKTGLQLK
jgi:hypothetical protein